MKNLRYIFVLFLISAGYLFSQSKINEQIAVDTIPSETQLVSEAKETADFYKYGIFNSNNNDTVKVYKKTVIMSDKLAVGGMKGGTITNKIDFVGISLALDIPIGYDLSITSQYFEGEEFNFGGSSGEGISFFGLGIGYISSRTEKEGFIVKLNSYLCKGKVHYFPYSGGLTTDNFFGLDTGADLLFKIYRPLYFSVSLEYIFTTKKSIGANFSFGLNFLY